MFVLRFASPSSKFIVGHYSLISDKDDKNVLTDEQRSGITMCLTPDEDSYNIMWFVLVTSQGLFDQY